MFSPAARSVEGFLCSRTQTVLWLEAEVEARAEARAVRSVVGRAEVEAGAKATPVRFGFWRAALRECVLQ